MPILRRVPCLAAVLLLSLFACSAPPPPTGSVEFAASIQALSASDVTRVKVTVSASDMSPLISELAKANGTWGGLIGNIPAGSNRSFLAEAFDSSNTKRLEGQTSGVSITANQTTAVAITLQEIAPPPPFSNEAPVIDSAVASITTVQTGASLSLTAAVHDPNAGDTLTLAWTASGGSFSAPSAATTSWTAPSSPGVQTLTFTVTDSQGAAASVSLAVNVVSGTATGNAAVNVSFNLWPVVSRVSASLNRLDAGQSTAVSATASDADGDALTYQWTATCAGTWTNATSSSASFVPSSVPAGVCNNCRLTVTVQDGHGGQTTGSLNLCIASSTTERFPPLVTNFYQSVITPSAGQPVTFDVTAMDPQSSTLTFAWSANIGSLATAQNTATTSRIAWTAPSCAPTGVTPTVTASVTNAYGVSASKSFAISGLPACVASGWSAASAMSSARTRHTATLLSSGKVLVAGGYNGSTYLSSAEVYDPATNTWSSAGSMASGRSFHTATRLPSGKVLVTGGYNGSSALATAQLYDPVTNTWSSAGSMATARYEHTATLLNTGKVLVAGGYNGSATFAQAEVYNPATNTWSSAGSMAEARNEHTATLLNSGKVLVTGGWNSTAQLYSTEVYDPATNAWSPAGSLSTPLGFHTATLLNSGKVLLAGGYYIIARPYAQLYDPATNSWSSTVYMSSARSVPNATLLASGKVLVSGGDNQNGNLSSAGIYDPATNSWSAAGSMSAAHYAHTSTLLYSGQVLITGGTYGATPLSNADLYTP
jgi:N-acetylneuraminic acid mutarotase